MYPNLYTLLVGPPGVGKTTAIREAREIIARSAAINLSPPMLSKEKFINLFSLQTKGEPFGAGMLIHSSYSVLLDEFTVFLRPSDNEMMTLLVDLYDCPPIWTYSTLNRKDDFRIENAALTILGGVTPKTLAESFGPSAIGMGFTARLMMIYSEDIEKVDLFKVTHIPDISDLVEDLLSITRMIGEFKIDSAAAALAEEWHSAGCPPLPRDSRFAEYNPRRPIHWLKMGMLISASKSSSKVILKEDLEEARDMLLEAEKWMPLALENFGQNPLAGAIKSIHKSSLIEFRINGKPIPEHRIRRMLMQDIPVQYHDEAINALLNGGWLTLHGPHTASPLRSFVPVQKSE